MMVLGMERGREPARVRRMVLASGAGTLVTYSQFLMPRLYCLLLQLLLPEDLQLRMVALKGRTSKGRLRDSVACTFAVAVICA